MIVVTIQMGQSDSPHMENKKRRPVMGPGYLTYRMMDGPMSEILIQPFWPIRQLTRYLI